MFNALLASNDSTQNSGGSFVFTLVFMALIGFAMYFLMIRPQRRRMRETAEMQKSIGDGDEILTNSGMYGFVNAMDGDVVWLEIAENVEIRVSRAAIARKVNPSAEPAGGPESAASEE